MRHTFSLLFVAALAAVSSLVAVAASTPEMDRALAVAKAHHDYQVRKCDARPDPVRCKALAAETYAKVTADIRDHYTPGSEDTSRRWRRWHQPAQ